MKIVEQSQEARQAGNGMAALGKGHSVNIGKFIIGPRTLRAGNMEEVVTNLPNPSAASWLIRTLLERRR